MSLASEVTAQIRRNIKLERLKYEIEQARERASNMRGGTSRCHCANLDLIDLLVLEAKLKDRRWRP